MTRKKLKYAFIITFLVVVLCTLLQGQVNINHKLDAATLIMEGKEFSEEDAEKAEEQLASNPDNVNLRIKLLGYYIYNQSPSGSSGTSRLKHTLWIILNYPENEFLSLIWAKLDPMFDMKTYQEGKELWLSHVKNSPENVAILGNAANYFLFLESNKAEDMLKKAQSIEPDNPEWADRLGQLYMLEMINKSGKEKIYAAQRSLSQFEKVLNISENEMRKFYLLPDLSKVAFNAGNYEKAGGYAEKLLSLASRYKDNWNYGNAIFHGNIILGRLAIRSGNIEEAKKYLIKAGKTPGSPQLNSFGPKMSLAKELLEKGEKDVVIEYLQLCGIFWESGKKRLGQWISIIESGEIPDFGRSE